MTLIAKVDGDTVLEVADYRAMFPNTSFTSSGPDQAFMTENSCLYVTVWLPYDQSTQVLEPATPYILDNQVYTVAVRDMTPEEIAAKEEAVLLAKRQAMVVTPFQAKAALLDADLLDDIEALMADPSTDRVVVLAWNNAIQFERLSPMVAGIASALGWTDEQLDALFEAAALKTA